MAITDEIPRSRITLTYRTNVNGEPEDIVLPFRVLIMGDLSGGTSKDRKLALDKRQIRRLDGKNLNAVMDDMDLSVTMSVKNQINPRVSESLDVRLPISSMNSFQPAEIAKHVPRVQALLLLRKLLLEAQAAFDNRKEFRNLLRDAVHDDKSVKALTDELSKFETYRIPAAKLKLNVPKEVADLAGLEIRRALLVPDPSYSAQPAPDAAKAAPAAAPAAAGAKEPNPPAAGQPAAAASALSTKGRIRRDEQLVEPACFNKEMRLKPGDYEITAFAPNCAPWSQTVTVNHDAVADVTVGPLTAS
jgi:type VI secretion system protein ImpB